MMAFMLFRYCQLAIGDWSRMFQYRSWFERARMELHVSPLSGDRDFEVFCARRHVPETITGIVETLGCRTSVLSDRSMVDMARIREGERIGVAAEAFGLTILQAGVQRLLALLEEPDFRKWNRAAVHEYLSLGDGTSHDAGVYRSLRGVA